MRRLATVAAIITLCSVSALAGENAETASVCDLQANPTVYNHKRIQVQGLISHEFEDFSIHGECSPSKHTVWLMYGGDAPDGVIYCCNGTGRKHGVQVDGIAVSISKDELFTRLDRLLNSYRQKRNQKVVYAQTNPSYGVEATLVGRYFAGDKGRGFGHLGCCSLFVIEKIASIDNVRSNLEPGELDCYTSVWSEPKSNEALAAVNAEILRSGAKWRTRDGRRVAEQALEAYLQTSTQPDSALKLHSCKRSHLRYPDNKDDQYEFQCNWSAGTRDSYHVDLLKFYFLKTPSNSWKDVAWMPYEITHKRCTPYTPDAQP